MSGKHCLLSSVWTQQASNDDNLDLKVDKVRATGQRLSVTCVATVLLGYT